jgi:hypothetical protein
VNVPPTVRILGIDLASDPKRTAACSVDWDGTVAAVRELREPVDDETAVALASAANLVAIDAPLGWPVAFGDAIAKHQRRETWPASSVRELSYRRTDLYVQDLVGLWPLSVSTDRIGIVAFRAARLLTLLRPGATAARDGSSGILEVYPAAALRRWGLSFRGYKGADGMAVRRSIVDGLTAIAPITFDGFRTAVVASDNALDALVAALVGVAKHENLVEPLPEDMAEAAAIEGWIWLPSGAPIGARGRNEFVSNDPA